MPIKGLTDRGLSFPEIGQIRKGAKKTARRPGKDLTYFRVEFAEGEEETDALFEKIYGTEPNNINVILPFNEIERCWGAWLEGYTAGRMVARSDGEYIVYQVDTETGDIKVINGKDVKTGAPVPYTEDMVVGKDYKGKPVTCKPVGRLRVFIPELGRAAYLTVLTSSLHDIANLSDQLGALKRLNYGQIAGIPLVLRRRPKKISVPMPDGKRVRQEKWMLSIEADPQWVRLKIAETKRLALPGNGELLPEPILEGEVVHEDGVPHRQTDLDPNVSSQDAIVSSQKAAIAHKAILAAEPKAAAKKPAAKSKKVAAPKKVAHPDTIKALELDPKIQEAIVEAGYAIDAADAVAMLQRCTIKNLTIEEAVAWGMAFSGFRDMGADAHQAAEAANEGVVPK